MITSYSTSLPNGLKLICNPMDNTNKLNITFVFHVGHYTDTKPGMAHLAEHMVFRGTDTISAKEIASNLYNLTGNSYTAYTAYGETVFSFDINQDKFADAVKVLVEMFTKSTCANFDVEKQIVGHELALRFDVPGINLLNITQKKSYQVEDSDKLHKDTLPLITQKDLSDFIKTNYVPNNCTLYVSGQIDSTRILEISIDEFTKDWQGSSNFKQPILPTLKYTSGLTAEKAPTKSAYCAVTFEGAKSSDVKDFIAQYIINCIIGDGLNSTIMVNTRIEKGLTYSVGNFNIVEPNHGLWGYISATDKASITDLLKQMMTSVKAIAPAITNDNVACARIALKDSLNKPIYTPVQATTNAMFYNDLGISKEEFVEMIDTTSTAEVKSYHNRMIGSKPCIALYGDVDDNYTEKDIMDMWESISVATAAV